mgnify:CR=1 FL=1
MNKKKDPKTEFLIVRVSPTEKKKVIEDAGGDTSPYIRMKLGL